MDNMKKLGYRNGSKQLLLVGLILMMGIFLISLVSALENDDDFNRADSSTVGNGWTDTAYSSISSNTLLRTSYNGNPGNEIYKSLDNGTTDNFNIKLKYNNRVDVSQYVFALSSSSSFGDISDRIIYIAIDGASGSPDLRVSNGAGSSILKSSAVSNTYYEVALKNIDWSTHTFDVWLDGVEKGTGLSFINNKNSATYMVDRTAFNEIDVNVDYVYSNTSGNPPISITLESPINGTTISDVGTNFTVSGNNISTVGNWTNVTYYIWNGTTLHNSTTIDFTDNVTFSETLFIDEFVLNTYTWNAEACYTNITGDYCIWATSNYTFDVVPFETLSTTYAPDVLEGSINLFATNISIISFERLSTVQFIYDGTAYTITPNEYATNEWYLPYNLTIPEVSANTNNSFYWSIRLESGLIYNTTAINQTVYNADIDDCSVFTNQIFNFTILDETSQAFLVGAIENTSLKVSMSLSSSINGEIVNFSKDYDKVNPSRVCLNYPMGNSTLVMDAVVEYSAGGRFVEFYNIQDYELNNETQSQNISLYNLKEDEGQEFKLTYKGLDFVPVSNLIVQIQRKYIEEGLFKVIEIPMSGTNGFTVAHLVSNDVIYNLIFIKDGEVLDTFTDVIAVCQNPTFNDCEINLNALVTGTDLFGLIEEDDFFSSLSYNKDTRTISSTYGITSGVSGTTNLEVYLMDNFGTTQVCNDSLIAAGGTLTCTVPASFGNSTIQAKILLNGDLRREGFIRMAQKPKTLYAGVLIFMSIIMFLLILGIGVQENPMIMGVFLILGLIILVGLNLVYTTSWIGAGATILWFIVAVVMVLVKGGNKR